MTDYKISFTAIKGNYKRITMRTIEANSPQSAINILKKNASDKGWSIRNETVHTEYFCSVQDCKNYGIRSKDYGKTWFCGKCY